MGSSKEPFKKKSRTIKVCKKYFKKNKRLNIRISERDLTELQKKAVSEGLPYQTYVASIIHKFISGKLVEAKS